MPKLEGKIYKMRTELKETVDYYLTVGTGEIYMNDLLGKSVSLKYSGQINCVHCGRRTKTSFAQGYCYTCFTTLPQTDVCTLRPELCEAQNGISRDMEWAEENCLKDHYVYLALTSIVKVGVTRFSQIPIRWIDQGAWKAIKLAKAPNRNLAGQIEVFLKDHLSDKTNWRHMLTNKLAEDVDLLSEKEYILRLLPDELNYYASEEDEITEITYPVLEYPVKVKSIGFDKIPEYTGILTGIKGQYLMFDNHIVLNIRKHAGYMINLHY